MFSTYRYKVNNWKFNIKIIKMFIFWYQNWNYSEFPDVICRYKIFSKYFFDVVFFSAILVSNKIYFIWNFGQFFIQAKKKYLRFPILSKNSGLDHIFLIKFTFLLFMTAFLTAEIFRSLENGSQFQYQRNEKLLLIIST